MFQGRPLSRLASLPALLALALPSQGWAQALDCQGAAIQEDVVVIAWQSLEDAPWFRDIEMAFSGQARLSGITTVTRDDKANEVECAAQYVFTYNGKERELPVSYYLAYGPDGKQVDTSAYTDDVVADILQLMIKESPVKNGLQQFVDEESGALYQTIEWKDNRKHAQMVWTRNGKALLAKLAWTDGKASGREMKLDPTGTRVTTDLTWKDGRATGYGTLYFENGLPREYHTLKDGVLHGPRKVYHATADTLTLVLDEHYKDGQLDGMQLTNRDGNLEQVVYKDGAIDREATAALTPPEVVRDPCVAAKAAAFMKTRDDSARIDRALRDKWSAECAGTAT